MPRDALPITPGELGEEEVARLFAARGDELHRVLAAADALRREVNGDEVTYVVTRNVNYTNVCYFKCGFCAFSKGKLAENLRGPAYVVPHEEIVRRAHEAWDRGAVEICLQGGIHPGFDGDYYASVVEAIKAELPTCTSTRSPRSRSGRARRRSACRSTSTWRGSATPGLASLPGDGRRDPRRRGARRPLPGQGEHRAVARGAPHGAPRRAALDRDDHVRPRGHAALVGAPPAPRPRAAAGDGRLHRARAAARSCTWRRRST